MDDSEDPMGVKSLAEASFRREVLESDVPVVIDFYADWCAPCRWVSPAVEALSREWEGRVKFFKVDIDRERRLAGAYRITSIPAVLLFEGGEVKAWSLGAKPGYLIERELGLARRRRRERRAGRRLLRRRAARPD